MQTFPVAAICALCVLTACGSVTQTQPLQQEPGQQTSEPQFTDDAAADKGVKAAKLVPKIFWINSHEHAQIPHRVLDAVNGIREKNDLPRVELSAELSAAARTHSRDMAVQNRPWHFGSDGSSVIDRVRRTGFDGTPLGEIISESYESDLATLSAWIKHPDTRKLILNPHARRIGIGWHQESRGKIWWTLVAGA